MNYELMAEVAVDNSYNNIEYNYYTEPAKQIEVVQFWAQSARGKQGLEVAFCSKVNEREDEVRSKLRYYTAAIDQALMVRDKQKVPEIVKQVGEGEEFPRYE